MILIGFESVWEGFGKGFGTIFGLAWMICCFVLVLDPFWIALESVWEGFWDRFWFDLGDLVLWAPLIPSNLMG